MSLIGRSQWRLDRATRGGGTHVPNECASPRIIASPRGTRQTVAAPVLPRRASGGRKRIRGGEGRGDFDKRAVRDHRLELATPDARDLLEDPAPLRVVRDLPGRRRDVRLDELLQVERQPLLITEVQQPRSLSIGIREAGDVEAAVEAVQHDLDPPRRAGWRPGGEGRRGRIPIECRHCRCRWSSGFLLRLGSSGAQGKAQTRSPLARISALCARLPAWYCASASGESTSPRVGCFGITSAMPGRETPYRLPRTARIDFAFIGPIPGSSSRRASRSRPSFASRQTFEASL